MILVPYIVIKITRTADHAYLDYIFYISKIQVTR